MNYTPKSVLIAGGSGFLGSNLIKFLHEKWPECNFVSYDKFTSVPDQYLVNRKVDYKERYQLVIGDIGNKSLVKKTMEDYEIDTIINCVGTVTEQKSIPQNARNIVGGLTNLLEIARCHSNLRLFLQLSTVEVYGEKNDEDVKFSEEMTTNPANIAAANAASCENFLIAWKFSYNMPIIIARVGNVYGPGQAKNYLVSKLIQHSLNGTLKKEQDLNTELNIMFESDFCKGIILLMEKGCRSEIYNLNSDEKVHLDHLIKIINDIVSMKKENDQTKMNFVLEKADYCHLFLDIDTEKIRKHTGWKCETELLEGLYQTISWYMREGLARRTEKLLIFGGNGWIGKHFVELCGKKQIFYELAKSLPGFDADNIIEEEIINTAPSHVVYIPDEHDCFSLEPVKEGPKALHSECRHHFFNPLMLAGICEQTGTHLAYISSEGYFGYENDEGESKKKPKFVGSHHSVVSGFMSRLMNHFDDVFNAKIGFPVSFRDEKENMLTRIINDDKIIDSPISITILPDILPIFLDLLQKCHIGTMNLVNPGPMYPSHIMEMCKKYIPKKYYTVVDKSDPSFDEIASSQSNCTLDTSILKKFYPGN